MNDSEVATLIQAAHESERSAIITIIQTVKESYGTSNVLDIMFRDELQGIIDKIKARA